MKQTLAIVVLLLFLIDEVTANSEPLLTSEKVITLGVVEFPPLVIKHVKDDSCYGEAIDVTSKILRELDYIVNVECIPPVRLFARVKTGHVDLTINVRGTLALDDNVTFVSKPFINLSIILAQNPRFNSDKVVSAIRGYDYFGERKRLKEEGFTFFDAANSTDAIRMFLMQRTSHLISYKQPYLYYLNNFSNTSISSDLSERLTIPSYLAVSKTSKYRVVLLEDLHTVTEALKGETIFNSYRKKGD